VRSDGGVFFRVWAPRRGRVEAIVGNSHGESNQQSFTIELRPEENGYFSDHAAEASPGMTYRYRLDGDSYLYPDPASRFQPQGPHGPSEIIESAKFQWTDQTWQGISSEGQVLYEMHIGTFSREGTWEAAGRELKELADFGITVIEVMPIADFPGRFGWGYDGVNLFAPSRLYGRPDDFRRFIDRAHEAGLGVILDVVYNHLGPDGNYLGQFSEDYFTDRYHCEWGAAINFDGANCRPVREYFLANAAYWIQEFHLDGLRIDATQQIYDSSSDHILAVITRRVREVASPRSVLIVGENEPQKAKFVLPEARGGYGIDTLWNDDFHHSAMVAMTGRADAYYSDYRGSPQEFISAMKWGYLYQGQFYSWQKQRRGTASFSLQPKKFVNYIQNHDQLANSGSGQRCHDLTSPSRYRAITTLFLLAPQTPMLFQGQEFAASSPFFYFADHKDELARLIAKGRAQFLSQFRVLATPEMLSRLPDPGDPMTFVRSKLDLSERQGHGEEYALHRDLLRMRKEDSVFRKQQGQRALEGAVLGLEAFVVRFFGDIESDDRLLIVNLGRDLNLNPAPEPLLAPPENTRWIVDWTSEGPRYGGWGTPPVETADNWHIQGEAAVVLRSKRLE
jgi:maltooligosyltrehalose trehalohydrolase